MSTGRMPCAFSSWTREASIEGGRPLYAGGLGLCDQAAVRGVGSSRIRRTRPACPGSTCRRPCWCRSAVRSPSGSRIITTAHRINQGSIPDLSPPSTDSDFYFVRAEEPEAAVARIVELVKTRIPRRFGLGPVRDIQVLCPMNRGGVGARALNLELQAAMNPAGERKVERFGWTFAPGDKVMQVENDYDKEVYNGDIGFVEDVDSEAGDLSASFDGRSVTYGFGELDTLVPAYAVTIHKSQGSEYPAVVIPVMTQHYAMLQRNLLYTGITRGKRLVVLVGQKKAVAIAVRNVSGRRRWSKLAEWLSSALPTA
jgi:exodeoxyribonuclease V alpha subunit